MSIQGGGPAFASLLELDERESTLIKESWALSEQKGYENTGQRIFNKIFILRPEIEAVFSFHGKEEKTEAFYKHIRAFMNMLEMAVSKCDRIAELRSLCKELGRRHVHFGKKGFHVQYWETFEKAIAECVRDWEDPVNSQNSIRAWTKLAKAIIFYMRMGYEEEISKKMSQT